MFIESEENDKLRIEIASLESKLKENDLNFNQSLVKEKHENLKENNCNNLKYSKSNLNYFIQLKKYKLQIACNHEKSLILEKNENTNLTFQIEERNHNIEELKMKNSKYELFINE